MIISRWQRASRLVCTGLWFVTLMLRAEQPPISFLDSNFTSAQISGTTEQVIAELSRELKTKAIIIGFGQVALGPSVYISVKEGSVREVLSELCTQDQRYEMLPIEAEQVVEILPRQQDAVKTLLQLRMSRVDIAVNEWPDNLIRNLPDFIPELAQYLAGFYSAHSQLNVQPGSPGISMNTNVVPPRYEVHMLNATTAEVLNAICIKSKTAIAKDEEVRTPLTPGVISWKAAMPLPERKPFMIWQKNLFSNLP